MIKFRRMTEADIPDALFLCRSAGWNQVKEDWQLFLTISGEGCLVAVDDNGKVMGTVTTVTYEQRFGWVGMVLVHPDRKRQGIGTALLYEAMRLLKDIPCMKLDATPAGREVYLKLGFKDEYGLVRMNSTSLNTTLLEAGNARMMESSDMTAVADFDAKIFGAARPTILSWQHERSPQDAYLVERDKKITAFAMARRGHDFFHVGPVVALNFSDAIAVTSAILSGCKETRICVDAFRHSPEWLIWLQAVGFEEQRPFTRMYYGANEFAGKPQHQFGILGPEFG